MFRKRDVGAVTPKENMEKKGGEMVDNRHQGRERIIAQWQRDAEELKHLVPDFDLSEAIRDENFVELLSNGYSVISAYAELMQGKKESPRKEITQNAQMARRGTGGSTVNPSKLSRAEFKKYIENIRDNG